MRFPVVADRLGNREDVSLGEGPAKRRSAMPAGAEADPFGGIIGIWPTLEVFPIEKRQIDKHLPRSRFASQRRNAQCESLPVDADVMMHPSP